MTRPVVLAPDDPFPALDNAAKRMIFIILVMGAALELAMSQAVAIAVPDIQGALGASFDEGSWILTVYSTTFLLFLAASNWLASALGFRAYVGLSTLLYINGAIGCATSTTLTQMLIFRGLMGAGGACFLVRAFTSLSRDHVGKDRLKYQLILVVCCAGLGKALGAPIGGYLCYFYNWRLVFYFCVPLGIINLLLQAAYLPDIRVRHTGPPDVIGFLLLAGWTVPLQIILSRGERFDWLADPTILALTVVATFCLPLFIAWEPFFRSRGHIPCVSLRVFANLNAAVGSVVVLPLGMLLYGQLYILPQFLRNVQDHTTLQTGLLLSINTIAFMAGILIAAKLLMAVGHRTLAVISTVMLASGLWLFGLRLTISSPDEAYYLPLILTGFPTGRLIPVVSNLMCGTLPPQLFGEGQQNYLLLRQLGGSVGTALLTIMIDLRRTHHSSRLGESLTTYSDFTREAIRAGGAALAINGVPPEKAAAAAFGVLHKDLIEQSVVNAFADTFYYQAAIAASATALVLVASSVRRSKSFQNFWMSQFR